MHTIKTNCEAYTIQIDHQKHTNSHHGICSSIRCRYYLAQQLYRRQLTQRQPPYAPTTSFLGGYPEISVDVPICAVFLAIFLTSAISNGILFQHNRRRGHFFLFTALFTGFSMARVLTCVLRIVWATRKDNVSVGIAATLFANLGYFILFIANLLFAQRILRARRPRLGWHPAVKTVLILAYCCLALVAVLVIVFTVLSYYTRDMSLLLVVKDVQLAAATYLFVFVVSPYLLLLAAWLPGLSRPSPEQTFGVASLEHKTIILLVLISLMTLDDGFKFGTAWLGAVYPLSNPPWYHSRACYYCFGFMLEVLYLIVVLAFRVDLKFHVPNGSSKVRSYAGSEEKPDRTGSEDL